MGTFSNYLYSILTSTKASKFRAGFIKKDGSYREGTFDLKNRKTWKQTDGTMYKRKGKKRTTDSYEYILAHDLTKKQPRNISVAILNTPCHGFGDLIFVHKLANYLLDWYDCKVDIYTTLQDKLRSLDKNSKYSTLTGIVLHCRSNTTIDQLFLYL